MDLDGKGVDMRLNVQEGWPLVHFTKNMPYWEPVQSEKVSLPDGRIGWRSAGASPTNKLFWWPLDERAKIERLGAVGGIRTYQVMYSPVYHVIVWDRGGWNFTPAVIIAGHESVIVGIHTGRIFRSGGTDLLHVRIQFQGTGHFQQSLFFTASEGALVDVHKDDSTTTRLQEFYSEHAIRPFHRGLGFCEDTLVELTLYESDPSGSPEVYCRPCRLAIRYRVDGDRLVIDEIGFAEDGHDCVMFPEWR